MQWAHAVIQVVVALGLCSVVRSQEDIVDCVIFVGVTADIPYSIGDVSQKCCDLFLAFNVDGDHGPMCEHPECVDFYNPMWMATPVGFDIQERCDEPVDCVIFVGVTADIPYSIGDVSKQCCDLFLEFNVDNDGSLPPLCARADCVDFYNPMWMATPVGFDIVEQCEGLGFTMSAANPEDADDLASVWDGRCEPYVGGICEDFGLSVGTPVYLQIPQESAEEIIELQYGVSANLLPSCRPHHMEFVCALHMPRCHMVEWEGETRGVGQQMCLDTPCQSWQEACDESFAILREMGMDTRSRKCEEDIWVATNVRCCSLLPSSNSQLPIYQLIFF
jgi:hypothetical protein